jgi:hypothetical protein
MQKEKFNNLKFHYRVPFSTMEGSLTRLKKHSHRVASIILLLMLILQGLLINPQPSQAATYTFQQTNWGRGATTTAATHPGNQTL